MIFVIYKLPASRNIERLFLKLFPPLKKLHLTINEEDIFEKAIKLPELNEMCVLSKGYGLELKGNVM